MSELQQSREERIIANKNLVYHLLKNYSIRPDDYDDIVQIGMIGLMKAVDTFDESRNFKFTTYAGRVIHNEIRMYFRKSKKYTKDISMNTVVGEGKNAEELILEDTIQDNTLAVSEKIEQQEYIEYVIDIILSQFSRRDTIIFLYQMSGMKQREIAERLQLSRTYISRIISRVQNYLKQYVESAEKCERRVFFVKHSTTGFRVMFFIKDLPAFMHGYQEALSLNMSVQDGAKDQFKVAFEKNKVIISFPLEMEYFSLLADIFLRVEEFEEKFQDYREEVRQEEREKARLKSEENKKKKDQGKATSTTKFERIRHYMLMQEEFSFSELKRVFSDIPLGTINSVIQSMKRKKLIERVSYGKYKVVKSEVGEKNW